MISTKQSKIIQFEKKTIVFNFHFHFSFNLSQFRQHFEIHIQSQIVQKNNYLQFASQQTQQRNDVFIDDEKKQFAIMNFDSMQFFSSTMSQKKSRFKNFHRRNTLTQKFISKQNQQIYKINIKMTISIHFSKLQYISSRK